MLFLSRLDQNENPCFQEDETHYVNDKSNSMLANKKYAVWTRSYELEKRSLFSANNFEVISVGLKRNSLGLKNSSYKSLVSELNKKIK